MLEDKKLYKIEYQSKILIARCYKQKNIFETRDEEKHFSVGCSKVKVIEKLENFYIGE